MDIETQKNNYATILVRHGLNVQKGQIVNISTEVIHRDFAMLIAEKAYECGAKIVQLDLIDPRLERCRIEKTQNSADLEFVPRHTKIKYEDLVDSCAANLKLIGPEEPDILVGVDVHKLNTMRKHHRLALQTFYEEGIGKSKVHWTVAAAATPKWAKKIFPHLSNEEACHKLWQEIFRICRADQSDVLQVWQKHNTMLQQRAQWLDSLAIESLHFVGPGTDLTVGLSPKARFKGGCDVSSLGVPFEPNIPTEECFTTPDLRKTHGTARITRPFDVHGTLVQGLTVRFEQGKIVEFHATEGQEVFDKYIHTDEGAQYLGEVALVGIDSPIYQTGLVFEEILFDENAACHIAVGSAYQFCLEKGETLSNAELQQIGCNKSAVHTDMMISDAHVDVYAKTYTDQTILLLEKGQWKREPKE